MKHNLKTPRWVDYLIDNLAPLEFSEEISGDLYELFLKDIQSSGRRKANAKYAINGLGFLAKSFFWKRSSHIQSNSSIMIQNYFRMASRSLLAHKGTTVINIFGLVIGICAALAILTIIRFELSFDSFHSNKDNIYRMVRISGSDMSEFRSGISYPVPAAVRSEITSIADIVSIEYFGGANVNVLDASGATVAKFREEAGCAIVEPNFFKVFDFNGTDFKWIAGNPEKALVEPMTVVLTKTMAQKYFGDQNPIGRILQFQTRFDFRVTGVIADLPVNTDFPFKILASYASLKVLEGEDALSDWFSVNDMHQAYVVLREGVTEEEVEKEIARVHAAHTPKDLHESRHYLLQKLSDVHYDARFGNFSGRTISKQTIVALGIIGLFLLLTGSINYINLATAQSALRAKEIGLRKVLGSNHKSIMLQFLTETFVVVSTSGVIALFFSEVLLKNFQSLFNIKFTGLNLTEPFILACLTAIIFVVTVFAGFYPALVISKFNPLSALKSKFSSDSLGGVSLRKILVVAQFTITQMLVVGTFIVVKQMDFFRNVDMGFNRDAIVTVRLPDPKKAEQIASQLQSQASISGISFSFTQPSGLRRSRSYQDIGKPEAASLNDYHVFEYSSIDNRYLDLYGIKLLAGRNVSMQDSVGNILINQKLVKTLGLGTPDEAIGRELKLGQNKLVTVVGVVGDFYSNSLKEDVDNMVFLVAPESYYTINVKLAVGDKHESLTDRMKALEKVWSATFPEDIFTYQFFDETIEAFYAQENKYAKLFQLFAVVFLVIGCLGLYGLITFLVNRKGKEVAVRKVLGANISNILILFSKEYIRLMVISFLLATPIAYYFVNDWLNTFANRIEIQWWLFLVPGVFVLALALIVVIAKSLKAANANPIETLRYE
jgi:putative ABC transport system permease protein